MDAIVFLVPGYKESSPLDLEFPWSFSNISVTGFLCLADKIMLHHLCRPCILHWLAQSRYSMMFVKQMDEYVTTEVFDCLIQTSIKVGNLIKVYIGISIVSMMKVFIYWLVSDIGSFLMSLVTPSGVPCYFSCIKHTSNVSFTISNFAIFKGKLKGKCKAV